MGVESFAGGERRHGCFFRGGESLDSGEDGISLEVSGGDGG